MRIAVLADIHGNIRALDAVIADMRGFKPDRVVNLGDCFSGPLFAAATADTLLEYNWLTIRGNHDRQLLDTPPENMGASDRHAFAQLDTREEDWLADLPATARIIEEDILLVHGTPDNDSEYLLETVENGTTRLATDAEIRARLAGTSAKVILCGHSHMQREVTLDDMLIVNPGSVGLQAYTDKDPWHYVETGTPHARYALLEKLETGWAITFRQVTYDWNAAAKDACKAGREDWAYALAKGLARRA